MKKILLVVALGLFVSFSASAQKYAYVNSMELLQAMPEYKKAETDLKAEQQKMIDQDKAMINELQTKSAAFEKDSAASESIKAVKQKELQDLYNRIQEFEASVAQKMDEKERTLMAPIMDKAKKAIQDVGKENGYDMIFDANNLLFAKEGNDLLPLVKAKLGIK